MPQWLIPARLVLNTTVVVEAENAQEAVMKFGALEWVNAGFEAAEVIDWDETGKPEEDK